jgi:L-iditol 2-dehydrogenase
MKNQTAYLDKASHIVIKNSAMPTVGDDDVLVKISHVTICGSDAHFFIDPTYGGVIIPPILPIVLGHESAGIIESIGKNVKGLNPGDKVAIEPGVPCGKCGYCMDGKYNLCDEMDFMAAPPFTRGALSRYVAHPAKAVFKLPDAMNTVEGALMEPLSVGLYAARRSGAHIGQTALVIGSGCIGLMTVAALKATGVDNIIVSDLYAGRLENAKSMGAWAVIDAKRQNVLQTVMELTGSRGADLVFETAGTNKTAAMTIDLVKKGGKIVMVGNIYGETPFKFIEANNKEVDLLSVFRYVNIYPMAISAVKSGKIVVKNMISKTFPFEETQAAFECAVNEKDTVIKVLIECSF